MVLVMMNFFFIIAWFGIVMPKYLELDYFALVMPK